MRITITTHTHRENAHKVRQLSNGTQKITEKKTEEKNTNKLTVCRAC